MLNRSPEPFHERKLTLRGHLHSWICSEKMSSMSHTIAHCSHAMYGMTWLSNIWSTRYSWFVVGSFTLDWSWWVWLFWQAAFVDAHVRSVSHLCWKKRWGAFMRLKNLPTNWSQRKCAKKGSAEGASLMILHCTPHCRAGNCSFTESVHRCFPHT